MATLAFERNSAATTGAPTWSALGAVTLVFSGAATDLTASISTAAYNDGTHLGSGTPGTDQCTTGPNSSHMSNVKYVDGTHVIINGAASAVLNDTNLVQGACTLRLHMNNGVSVATQNSRLWTFDGSTDTVEAVGIEAWAYEQGVSQASWFHINDDTGNLGGNNTGEFLDIAEKSAAVDSFWYIAISAHAQSAGGKSQFSVKGYTEVF